ncbi:methyltransferase domain-containing protein [Mesorhizobium sp. M7D.F.Ca.US.005.01.1.1]|uniref:class I SAM-dependent methyltransferase n=1 Tax=Mesorhizobium sp. M7D.F.Ca.US.005.01.1.1 TaxID=2493678 RepID=UPI0013E07D96|nr:methyltransferase domain-containing protein [Mesorhizobium sp. M7D.F.Ca.US.005.01.1.1]
MTLTKAAPIRSSQAFKTSDFLRALAEVWAKRYSVSPEIHEYDHIFGHLVARLSTDDEMKIFEALKHYFENGAANAQQVRDLMTSLGLASDARVLEFANGYGRVTRHLKDLNFVACDIHPEAVSFCADVLGVKSIASASVPEDWKPEERFDFIFAISLWSHLPDGLFQRWLSSVCAALNPGGYLMFSTHGALAATVVPQLAEVIKDGQQYGYLDGSDQKDLDPSIYGSTIVLPPYVIKAIYGATKARIVSFKPAGWWSLQDEWIIQIP